IRSPFQEARVGHHLVEALQGDRPPRPQREFTMHVVRDLVPKVMGSHDLHPAGVELLPQREQTGLDSLGFRLQTEVLAANSAAVGEPVRVDQPESGVLRVGPNGFQECGLVAHFDTPRRRRAHLSACRSTLPASAPSYFPSAITSLPLTNRYR